MLMLIHNSGVLFRTRLYRTLDTTLHKTNGEKQTVPLWSSKRQGIVSPRRQLNESRATLAESFAVVSTFALQVSECGFVSQVSSGYLLLLATNKSLQLPTSWSYPLQSAISFVLGVICASFIFRGQQLRRSKVQAKVSYRQALAEISTLDEAGIQELFDELPTWLTFREFERGGWLNKVVSAAWPYLDQATSNVIVNALDPILQATRPNFLTTLRFERFSFGSVPARIESVKVYESAGEEAVEIDLQVFWAGDPDVVLGVRAAQDNLAVPVSLTEVKCKFTIRLIFAPLIGKFPCFGALTIALTEEPEIVFDLRVVGGDITLVPGLAQPLRTYIKALISSYLVWPRCMTIPIPGTGYSLPSSERKEEHSGLLHVEVVSHDVLTSQPGELGLEVCWPGSGSIEEKRVKALPGGKTISSEPIFLLVMDPRYQILRLRWYDCDVGDVKGVQTFQTESTVVLEDLACASMYNDIAITDITKSWGPITLAAELDPVTSETEIREVGKTFGDSARGRLSKVWSASKKVLVKAGYSLSPNVTGNSRTERITNENQHPGAKIVQLTLRYQAFRYFDQENKNRVQIDETG